jgi:hypothetical protein
LGSQGFPTCDGTNQEKQEKEMKYLLATALVLSLCLPASADWRKDALADLRAAKKADPPPPAGANGWAFDVITIWRAPRESTVRREPYGVFSSKDECEKARAKKIAVLDEGHYRQPHLLPNQPMITTSITVGNTTTTSQVTGGPTETMNVLSCRAGTFANEDRTVAQKN